MAPRNRFRGIDFASLCSLAGQNDKWGCRTCPLCWESILGLLKRSTNTGADALLMCLGRRKIRLIESNAKCRYLKNWPVKGHCGRCFICLRSPSITAYYPPPLITIYTALCVMFLMRADALRGPSEIARADRRVQFWAHGAV